MFARKGGQLAEDELCAWDVRGDTCTRDLGGPLSVKINERYHVVGLNSFVNVEVSTTSKQRNLGIRELCLISQNNNNSK